MWIALFIISIAAAIFFGVAAILLQGPNAGDPIRVAALPPPGSGNTALLLHRMQSLHLDADEFRRSKPIAFRELLLRCETCDSRACCASDIADECADDLGKVWRDYCPSSAMLNALSTLRDCYSILTDTPRC